MKKIAFLVGLVVTLASFFSFEQMRASRGNILSWGVYFVARSCGFDSGHGIPWYGQLVGASAVAILFVPLYALRCPNRVQRTLGILWLILIISFTAIWFKTPGVLYDPGPWQR